MAHSNRGRLIVDKGGDWRLYTNTLPAGAVPLGTVARGESDIGALVHDTSTGMYMQVNLGVPRNLDQRKIAAALQRTTDKANTE